MAPIVDRRNLDFLLYELLQIDSLFEHERFAHLDRAVVGEMVDMSQRLAQETYLPCAATLDSNEPKVVGDRISMPVQVGEALRAYAQAGLFAQTFDEEVGGLQLPFTVSTVINGLFMAANVSVANYSMLTVAAAHLLEAFASEERKSQFLRPMLEGRWFGTMCLSETQAGSSLADIRTRAEPSTDGSYAIIGDKMWISGGDHELSENIVHMVLARIPDGPAGVKGISLFIVPRLLNVGPGSAPVSNNIGLVGLNHKMGHRGTTNCALRFGDGGRTVGYLVGEPHQGLRYMFHMMNEARVGVGLGATMSGLSGYLYSLDYARERLQGRPLVAKNPAEPQVPIIEHVDIRRMLLAQKAAVEGGIALCTFAASLIDRQSIASGQEERAELAALLDLLTPIVKSWPSEFCLEANKLAIQILGGAGYTRDHPVERFYRDNRLNHIHEGTWGIQGLDLLGRKVRLDEGRGLELIGRMIGTTIREAQGDPALTDHADQLARALNDLLGATRACVACPDAERGLANATPYLDAFGHVVVAWLWLWQGIAARAGLANASAHDRPFYEGKLAACRYFFRYMLPSAVTALALVESLDDTCMLVRSEQF